MLGRFTQPDPVVPEPGDPQSWNRYSYVRNNPVNRVDPTGNEDLEDDEASSTSEASPDGSVSLVSEVVGLQPGDRSLGMRIGEAIGGRLAIGR